MVCRSMEGATWDIAAWPAGAAAFCRIDISRGIVEKPMLRLLILNMVNIEREVTILAIAWKI